MKKIMKRATTIVPVMRDYNVSNFNKDYLIEILDVLFELSLILLKLSVLGLRLAASSQVYLLLLLLVNFLLEACDVHG